MSASAWIAAVGAAVAIASAIFSTVQARRARTLMAGQYEAQVLALHRQYFAELRTWADAAVTALTSCIFACDIDGTKNGQELAFVSWLEARRHLSAIIDQGRFFLPNLTDVRHGAQNAPAYRGYSQPAVHTLTEAFKRTNDVIVGSAGANDEIRAALTTLRRQFVSEVQRFLDPVERERELRGVHANAKGVVAMHEQML